MTDWLTRRWQLVGGLLVFLLAGKVSWPTYFRLTANRHFILLRPLTEASCDRADGLSRPRPPAASSADSAGRLKLKAAAAPHRSRFRLGSRPLRLRVR